ncbi:MAG: phospholipid carrier-dependent glycosyltransferase [Candidatus Woesebacteria bacterium]|jgi:hypothetical protein
MNTKNMRLPEWIKKHWVSIEVLMALMFVVGLANAWNLHGWPARLNDDEATYVDQAWAFLHNGTLSHYTYWYDHPPMGWIFIAAYAWVTDGFDRLSSAVMVGREAMWFVVMASCALIYLLVRRLNLSRFAAVGAVLIFGLSPLAIYEHRMAFLDNPATMWLLAAMVFALSPKKGLGAAMGAGICLALAVLTKETIGIMLPVVIWLMWRNSDRRTRIWNISVFVTIFGLLGFSYVLFAILKGELIPGSDHVSLGWALWYQFIGREGSGSVFDSASDSYRLVHVWFALDSWLLWAGLAAAFAGLFVKKLRPFAVAVLMQVSVVFKGGYLPSPYVIAVIPFMSVLVTGVLELLWKSEMPITSSAKKLFIFTRRFAMVTTCTVLAVSMASVSISNIRSQSFSDGDLASLQATEWLMNNISKDDVVIVDDYIWGDLKIAGYNPVWYWKTSGDPQVTREILPEGYKNVDYVAMPYTPPSTLESLPVLGEAIKHSTVVASFGGSSEEAVTIYCVDNT